MNRSRVSFKTVGCRLNQAETAAMRASFRAVGFDVVPFGAECEVCVIHGCAITANAERDSLRLARSARRQSPSAFIVLAGCVVEMGGEALRAACGADLAVGQSDKLNLPAIISNRGICAASDVLEHQGQCACKGPIDILPDVETTRAIVKIQDGCDFSCSYCVVPRLRGRSRSRPVGEVLGEIAGLGENGFKEVVLTGANIGCYDDSGARLADLLEQVESVPSVERIRISSIEISTVEKKVIDFMSHSKKMCRFLHLPLQSGDDGVLRAMRRRYNAGEYRDLIGYAMEKLGVFGLGADILVGFPGEDDLAFSATEALVNDLPFSRLHIFTYSERPGTQAAGNKDNVPGAVKNLRSARIARLGEKKQDDFARAWIGKQTSVLIESLDQNGNGRGWTGEFVRAIVSGPAMKINEIVDFVPQKAEKGVLVGNARRIGRETV